MDAPVPTSSTYGPIDPEQAEYFRRFGDGSQILPAKLKQAYDLFGFEADIFQEVQTDKRNYIMAYDKPTSVKIQKDEVYKFPCPVCGLCFARRVDLIVHCFANRATPFCEQVY